MAFALPKPRPKLLDKRAIAATKLYQWRELRKTVLKRDGNRCRACGRKASEIHHILFRSLGGKDEASNLLALCDSCHQSAHGHVLKLRWSNDRNRAASVKFDWVTP